jgi:taurine dioxygenase
MDTARLGPTIGARIDQVALANPLDDAAIAAVRAALVEHKVLVFPAQHLTPSQLVAAAAQFGELTPAHPVLPPIDAAHPEVLEIDATRSRLDPRYRDEYENDTWHTDVSFMPDPPLGSLLSGVVIPDVGGDTAFADMHAAYTSLSAPVRRLVDGLGAEHTGAHEFAGFLRDNPTGGMWSGRRFTVLEPVVHPVVRAHPESGRPSLFVNPTFTTRIVGLARHESDAVLELLYRHAVIPEHVFRHRWSTGDVVFWDNRSTMHLGVRDYGERHRVLHRVTLAGERPQAAFVAAEDDVSVSG